MIVYLVMGISFGFAAAVQPGPTQTFMISRAITSGWRHALPLSFVYVVSDIPIVILVILILSNLPEWVEDLLHLAGGFFLLFLAWGAYKNFKNYRPSQPDSGRSATWSFLKAVTVNLLNPNPYLTWSLVMGPLLLTAWRECAGYGTGLLAGFYGSLILTTAGIILVFVAIRKLGTKVNKILIGISGLALAGFGVYQILLGTIGLWAK